MRQNCDELREPDRRSKIDEKWGRYCYRPHSHRRWVPEGTLIAWRVSVCSSPLRVWPSGYVARRSRRCRIGALTVRVAVRPILTGLAACPWPGHWLWRLERFHLAASCHVAPSTWGTSPRPSDHRSLWLQQSGFAWPEGLVSPFLHRNDVVIASSSLRFPTSCLGRRYRELVRLRSRWIENAHGCRVGQGGKRRLIHFPAKCQWTRVDKSTPRRRS